MTLSRRSLLQLSAGFAAASALGAPRKARAAPAERKFLFFFAGGGWDTTTVLDPHYEDPTRVSMDEDTVITKVGGLEFTGGPDRMATERYFRRWGKRAAIVNGVNAHSVGHDSAAQFVLTGTSASSYSDWPTLIAAKAENEYPLPHMVFSGPVFPGTNGQAVVRAGGGTLLQLIDGSLNGRADRPTPLPQTPADTMMDSIVHRRVSDWAKDQTGLSKVRGDGMLKNLERAMELEGRRFEAGLDDLGNTMLDQAIKAVEMMRLGLTRCAMIGIPGGWDSHGNNMVQGPQQDAFFGALDQLFEHMAATPGQHAQWLIDEVVVVAQSEFGRTPVLNGGGGKDHWPFTSMLVAGSGVNGNRVLGKTDLGLVAEPISLSTGQPDNSGMDLGCEHVGLGLLRLAGIDPASVLPGVPVLDALVKNA